VESDSKAPARDVEVRAYRRIKQMLGEIMTHEGLRSDEAVFLLAMLGAKIARESGNLPEASLMFMHAIIREWHKEQYGQRDQQIPEMTDYLDT
jgi:hypothetical protein